jgi:cell shape-determining protein MreC
MSAPISGKVAAIIDNTTLVINVGRVQGVEEGMGFIVYAEHQEIVDPDSAEVLGKWEIIKDQVVVSHVQERMSTVRSLLTEVPQNSSTLSSMMVQHSLGHYGLHDQERQTLQVQVTASSGRPQDQFIKLGDLVRAVAAPKLEDEGNSDPSAAETSQNPS